jgi:hypothetical protein
VHVSISRCSSRDSRNADTDYKQQRNNSDLLPLPATAAFRPPQNQSLYLDGNSSRPASRCLYPPLNNNADDSAPVSDAGGDTTPTGPLLFLGLIVGLLAMLWVWALDEAMILRPRLRLRSGMPDEAAMGREKGGCRCRVCTLRMQARGQPLHEVSDNMA